MRRCPFRPIACIVTAALGLAAGLAWADDSDALLMAGVTTPPPFSTSFALAETETEAVRSPILMLPGPMSRFGLFAGQHADGGRYGGVGFEAHPRVHIFSDGGIAPDDLSFRAGIGLRIGF